MDDPASATARDWNDLVKATWPIMWVRSERWLIADGHLQFSKRATDRVWPIPAGAESAFLVPRRGTSFIPEAHEPITWKDGSRMLTKDEAQRLAEASKKAVPGDLPWSGTDEEKRRWAAASERHVREGTTDEQILRAYREQVAAGSTAPMRAAARELGIKYHTFYGRLRRLRESAGEVEPQETLRERVLRKRNYGVRGLYSDQELLDAYELADRNVARAARMLGLARSSFSRRLQLAAENAGLKLPAPRPGRPQTATRQNRRAA
jgi:transposase